MSGELDTINEEEEKSLKDLVVFLVTEFKWLIYAIVAFGILTLIGYFDFFTIPPEVFTTLQWSLIAVILLFLPFYVILDFWLEDDVNPLFVLDLADVDADKVQEDTLQLWNFGDKAYKNLRWKREPYFENGIPIAISYDPDEHVATGPWIAELSTTKLIRFQGLLQETRQELVKMAAEGVVAKASRKTDAIKSQDANIEAIVRQLLLDTTLGAEEIIDSLSKIEDDIAEEVANREDPEDIQKAAEKAEQLAQQGNAGGNDE